jgi:alkylation response protein AidB-like acyl-CoA dehydrogenase
MQWELSSDQEFFRQTTAKFLAEQTPADEVRRLRHQEHGFDDEYWRRGADLGWTSLLVGDDAGGGSISGRPVVDLTLVAYEFGRHAAPGPLVSANAVAAALGDTGAHPGVLADVMSGAAIVSWCFLEPPIGDPKPDAGLEIRVDGADLVVTGAARPVESACRADQLLVTGRTDDGLTQVLVPADADGVSISALRSVDLTRRFGTVAFDSVRVPSSAAVGAIGGAGAQVERMRQLAIVMLCAESVGAMQRGFEMTVEWASDRYSFGRPLASYQALKHRFADLKMWLEAAHAISDAAAGEVDSRAASAALTTSVAKAFVGDQGTELLQDCVQLHGGMGLTFEHDLHLFLRRATVNRTLCGTPAQHRRRLADGLIEQQEAA